MRKKRTSPTGRPRRRLWWLGGAAVVGLLAALLFAVGWPGTAAPHAVAVEDGMALLPGGEFWMGSDDEDARPDEKPVHRVRLDAFWMDRHEVTNEEFARFVRATGHVTDNEKRLESQGMVHTDPEKVEPGGMVFRPPAGDVVFCAGCECQWWKFQQGADWRHPDGPGSGIDGKEK